MTRALVLRFLESFFRHRVLYLLPVVLMAGVGAWAVTQTEPTYRSIGTLNVEGETFLSTLTDVQADNFGYETPSSATSNKINSLLHTDRFFGMVVAHAGLEDEIEADPTLTDEFRGSVIAVPASRDLLNVIVVYRDPTVAQLLADSTIQAFIQWIVDADIGESTAAEEFFTEQLEGYQTALNAARLALSSYLQLHPAPAQGQRPDEQVAEIARLDADIDQVQARLTEALTKREDARLSIQQTTRDISQRLQVVDSPQTPSGPLPRLKNAVFTAFIFLAVGIFLSLVTLVVGTLIDQTIRSAADVKDRLGARLLAVVPDAGPTRLIHPKRTDEATVLDAREQVRIDTAELAATRAG